MDDQHGYFIVDNHNGEEPVIVAPGRDYVLKGGGTLIAYHGNEASVEVPWSVKTIAAGAFKDNVSVQRVEMGGYVTTIEAEAFMGCTSLETVVVKGDFEVVYQDDVPVLYGETVEVIGDRAFKGCSALKELVFDGQDPDEGGTWQGYLNIGVEAFAGCTSLEVMELNCVGGWLSVADRAFAGCTSLWGVELSDALGELGKDVFEGCTALSFLSVPAYLREGTESDNAAYEDAIQLIREGHPGLEPEMREVSYSYEDRPWVVVIWSAWAWTPERFRRRRTQIVYRDVASWWRGRRALGLFKGFPKLRTVDLTGFDASHETSIACMFKGCASLETVTLDGLDTSQVTDMRQLFFGCRSLRRIDLSSLNTAQVESMAHLFHNCRSLERVSLAGLDVSKVQSLWSAFDGCSSLVEIDLSGLEWAALEKVGYVFRGCTSLRRWSVSASWPVTLRDAIPLPTNEQDAWWSVRDQRWMTARDISVRGPVADTYLSEPEAAQEPEGSQDEGLVPDETPA